MWLQQRRALSQPQRCRLLREAIAASEVRAAEGAGAVVGAVNAASVVIEARDQNATRPSATARLPRFGKIEASAAIARSAPIVAAAAIGPSARRRIRARHHSLWSGAAPRSVRSAAKVRHQAKAAASRARAEADADHMAIRTHAVPDRCRKQEPNPTSPWRARRLPLSSQVPTRVRRRAKASRLAAVAAVVGAGVATATTRTRLKSAPFKATRTSPRQWPRPVNWPITKAWPQNCPCALQAMGCPKGMTNREPTPRRLSQVTTGRNAGSADRDAIANAVNMANKRWRTVQRSMQMARQVPRRAAPSSKPEGATRQ